MTLHLRTVKMQQREASLPGSRVCRSCDELVMVYRGKLTPYCIPCSKAKNRLYNGRHLAKCATLKKEKSDADDSGRSERAVEEVEAAISEVHPECDTAEGIQPSGGSAIASASEGQSEVVSVCAADQESSGDGGDAGGGCEEREQESMIVQRRIGG